MSYARREDGYNSDDEEDQPPQQQPQPQPPQPQPQAQQQQQQQQQYLPYNSRVHFSGPMSGGVQSGASAARVGASFTVTPPMDPRHGGMGGLGSGPMSRVSYQYMDDYLRAYRPVYGGLPQPQLPVDPGGAQYIGSGVSSIMALDGAAAGVYPSGASAMEPRGRAQGVSLQDAGGGARGQMLASPPMKRARMSESHSPNTSDREDREQADNNGGNSAHRLTTKRNNHAVMEAFFKYFVQETDGSVPKVAIYNLYIRKVAPASRVAKNAFFRRMWKIFKGRIRISQHNYVDYVHGIQILCLENLYAVKVQTEVAQILESADVSLEVDYSLSMLLDDIKAEPEKDPVVEGSDELAMIVALEGKLSDVSRQLQELKAKVKARTKGGGELESGSSGTFHDEPRSL